jgi:hypothetical protein
MKLMFMLLYMTPEKPNMAIYLDRQFNGCGTVMSCYQIARTDLDTV